jgi:hypothetical protein
VRHKLSSSSYRATKTIRALALCIVVLWLLLAMPSFVSRVIAQGGNAQVWGQRYRDTEYWGVSVLQNTPNPAIPAGQWTGGPVGMTNLVGHAFIESGPTKACDRDCGLHPYGSWGNVFGQGGEFVDLSATLGAGLNYRYKSVFIGGGGTSWQSQWCDGVGCRGMITGDVARTTLPYVAAGGESSGPHWGNITTSNSFYLPANSNQWSNWCYTSTTNNVGGTISACNNWSWTSSY